MCKKRYVVGRGKKPDTNFPEESPFAADWVDRANILTHPKSATPKVFNQLQACHTEDEVKIPDGIAVGGECLVILS